MIESLSDKLTSKLVDKRTIKISEYNFYKYGFEIMISTLIGMIETLIIGVVLNSILLSVVFYIVFTSLRFFTGGYHADTYLNCKIIFGITCLMSTIISKYFYSIFKMPYIIIMGLIYLIIVILLCPCENKHKKLTEQIKRKNKIISIIYSILILSASIFLYNSYKKISVVILITTIFVGIYVCIAKLTERRKCYVKDI